MTKSFRPASRARRNCCRVSTRSTAATILSISSMARSKSVSMTSSSRWRMRSGDFIKYKMVRRRNDFLPASARAVNILGRRLIDHRPKSADLPDGVDEFPVAHRFDDVGVHAQLIASDQIAFLRG